MIDVKCPYCGYGVSLCHDDGVYFKEDNFVDTECPECEKTFSVSTSIRFTYNSHATGEE